MSLYQEVTDAVYIANSEGYTFHCAKSRECDECSQRPIAFVTKDIDEAYKHSIRNGIPTWIEKR